MRKLSKGTTIVASIIICIILVVGFLVSFVPMTFGSNSYVSLVGSINVSSDLVGGMYGEYDITTENPTSTQLVNSMSKIKEVFEGEGYKNVNVYTVGSSKLRVEVSYPTGDKTYSDVYSDLSIISSGKFYLCSSSSISTDGAVVVDGTECVSEVRVFTNNSTNYMSIIFNEYGQEQYKALCEKTTTIYMILGSYNQSISASDVTDYTSFTLSDSDYENLMALQNRIIIGCMDIEINSNTAIINTMSSSLASLGSASSPEENGFASSSALILLVSALAVVIVVGLAFFAIKFGLFAIVILISLLFNSYLFLIALCLIPSVEIGFTSIFSMVLGLSVIYIYTYNFASSVKSEYELGKSFGASLESAYKKNFASSIIGNIGLFISSLIVFAFSLGEISSASIVFAICSFLSIITNFAIIPLLVKIGISFDKVGPKLFMLKKRNIGFEMANDNDDVKESK